jgi:predicted nucleic acid-binding protein
VVYVLDASFVGAVIIPDEKNSETEKIYMQIKDDDAKYVPSLFSYEMANIFMNLIRHKRHTYAKVLELIPVLSSIRIITDFETGPDYTKKLLFLSSEYGLSSCDAAYLELAERKNAALCTLDERLQAAAKKRGVPVLE